MKYVYGWMSDQYLSFNICQEATKLIFRHPPPWLSGVRFSSTGSGWFCATFFSEGEELLSLFLFLKNVPTPLLASVLVYCSRSPWSRDKNRNYSLTLSRGYFENIISYRFLEHHRVSAASVYLKRRAISVLTEAKIWEGILPSVLPAPVAQSGTLSKLLIAELSGTQIRS